MGHLRQVLIWLTIGLALFCCLMVFFIANLFVSHRKLEPLLKLFAKLMIAIPGMRLEVEGLENIDSHRTYILLFNHNNIFDHFAIYAVFPGILRGIEKESHFKWPLYGRFLKNIEQIPIAPRGKTQSAMASLEKAKHIYRSGIHVGIAPEGTRSPDGKLLPFKKGAFHMAVELGAPLLPMVFEGMHDFNAKGSFWVSPGKVKLRILPAIETQGIEKAEVTALKNRVEKIYREILG